MVMPKVASFVLAVLVGRTLVALDLNKETFERAILSSQKGSSSLVVFKTLEFK